MPPVGILHQNDAKTLKLFNDDLVAGLDYCSGEVNIRGSFTVSFACSVHYENYPFDSQRCLFALYTRQLRL